LAIDVPLAPLCFTVILVVSICQQTMAQNSSPAPRRDINAVLVAHDKQLLAIPGVVGIYVATLDDGRTPCLKIILAEDKLELRGVFPTMIEGYPVVLEVTGEIRALDKP
jgi:hypothetical protein